MNALTNLGIKEDLSAHSRFFRRPLVCPLEQQPYARPAQLIRGLQNIGHGVIEARGQVGLVEADHPQIMGHVYVEAVHPWWDVTLDVDVQLVDTTKVCWAETMLVLSDEFRQGNASPSRDITRLVDEACEMLPPGPWQVKVRSDSAAYQQEVLDHW